ncbi:MAG: hypothetical protein AB4058_08990 [Microcystaceae cyanobacterium]
MINRLTITFSVLTTALAFGLTNSEQASGFPSPPVVTTFESTTTSTPPADPWIQDSGGTQNTAVVIEGIVVNLSDSPNRSLSQEYKVCFEYGQYTEIFDVNRTDTACRDILGFDITHGNPVFLGKPNEAADSIGMLRMENGVSVADGMFTALDNSLTSVDGNDIRRVVAAAFPPLDFGFLINEVGNTEFYVPHTINGSNVEASQLRYNNIEDLWQTDNTATVGMSARVIYARFEAVGEPFNVEMPEPATVVGLLVTGAAGLLSTHRR